MHSQAVAAENAGKNQDAIRLYVKAASAGSGDAAKRLGDIYDKAKSYSEALKWYNVARRLHHPGVPRSKCG